MAEHQGEFIKKYVPKLGFVHKDIAAKLGLQWRTYYARLEKELLNPFFVDQISKAVGKDLRKEFPGIFREAGEEYKAPKGLTEVTGSAEFWKDKYIQAQETIIELQQQLVEMKHSA